MATFALRLGIPGLHPLQLEWSHKWSQIAKFKKLFGQHSPQIHLRNTLLHSHGGNLHADSPLKFVKTFLPTTITLLYHTHDIANWYLLIMTHLYYIIPLAFFCTCEKSDY